jgi:hypothetical protein
MRSQNNQLPENFYLDFDDYIIGTHTATITVSYIHRESGSRIVALFRYRLGRYSYSSLQPVLTFSAVIPSNSLAFQLARAGDLDGIRTLLNNGKASISNCDGKGKTMLHVCSQRPLGDTVLNSVQVCVPWSTTTCVQISPDSRRRS